MRISSLIRRTLGFKGHLVERVTEENGRIAAEIVAHRRSRPNCSSCGRKKPGCDALQRRTWRHAQMRDMPVAHTSRTRRGGRGKCGIEVEAMPWSCGGSPLSLPHAVALAA